MNRCPKCDRALIAFCDSDYDKEFLDGVGVKCHPQKCGYNLTFGGLLNHAEEIIKYVNDWPDCCPSLMLEGHIRAMRKTIAKGM